MNKDEIIRKYQYIKHKFSNGCTFAKSTWQHYLSNSVQTIQIINCMLQLCSTRYVTIPAAIILPVKSENSGSMSTKRVKQLTSEQEYKLC